MPIAYVIDRFRQRMFTRAEGLVTFDEINAHLEDEAREHGLALPELVDARAATTNITPAQVRQLVARVRNMIEEQPFGPTAIVTTDDLAFGMARMFSILAERYVRIEVFREPDTASAWLDAT